MRHIWSSGGPTLKVGFGFGPGANLRITNLILADRWLTAKIWQEKHNMYLSSCQCQCHCFGHKSQVIRLKTKTRIHYTHSNFFQLQPNSNSNHRAVIMYQASSQSSQAWKVVTNNDMLCSLMSWCNMTLNKVVGWRLTAYGPYGVGGIQ